MKNVINGVDTLLKLIDDVGIRSMKLALSTSIVDFVK